MYDFLSKDENLKDKIRRHREKELEKKVADIFKSVFNDTSSFVYENYFVTEGHEQDLLILTKGTAIIVETKASKLREPFRDIQKAVVRLKSDFKDAVQYGYEQCKRIEDFFSMETSFDIRDNKGRLLYTVNPVKYHSVFSIVVTLERFGSLQTDLNLLLQKDVADNYPWSVYIDDLEIFLITLKHHRSNPRGKFLDFLSSRRRYHGHIYAIDELDVCGYYLKQPEKFKAHAKKTDTLCQFSVYEQAIFDEIYHSGGLRFKEEPMPDFYRYFEKNNNRNK
jgi:Nuclease-related domain